MINIKSFFFRNQDLYHLFEFIENFLLLSPATDISGLFDWLYNNGLAIWWRKMICICNAKLPTACKKEIISGGCFALLHDWKIKKKASASPFPRHLSFSLCHVSRGDSSIFVQERERQRERQVREIGVSYYPTHQNNYHSDFRAEGEKRSPKIRKREIKTCIRCCTIC